jgi:hypothetical protein
MDDSAALPTSPNGGILVLSVRGRFLACGKDSVHPELCIYNITPSFYPTWQAHG